MSRKLRQNGGSGDLGLLRKSLSTIRREELVQAAISVIAKEGVTGATLATIARRADMSPALVSHYFDGKDELLALTLLRITSLVRRELLRRLPANATPQERLLAIIGSNFDPQLYEPEVQMAWLQFGLIFQDGASEPLRRINRMLERRFRSNIGFAFRQAIPANRVADAVDGMIALVDGYSWRFLVNRNKADFDTARRVCAAYVDSQLKG